MSELTKEECAQLLNRLEERFMNQMERHEGITWSEVEKKLLAQPDKLISLSLMEKTGGEPDVVLYERETDEYVFFDCSAESPKGRRSVCYDRQALDARKKHKPENSALDLAAEMGVELLSEEQYRYLQTLGSFDLKTSSWIQTPDQIRNLGGALFCDRRYDHVFVYHNGADSYYSVRGFRSFLRV